MKIDRDAPVGVFDSGIGGLTVAREIMRNLPAEKIVYFGDTARVPYGSKSRETIIGYSRQIIRFLKEQKVKAIVVACNTASAFALDAVKDELDIPILGVIEAGAKEVPEDDMFNALMEAHEELKKVCAFIQSIKDEIGKPKFEYEHHDIDHDLFDKLEAACNDKFEIAMDTDDKTVRDAGVRAIVDEFEATLDEEYKEEHGANLGECVDKLQKKIVRPECSPS